MIIGIIFLLGLTTGLVAGLILFYILFHDDLKALDKFDKRQERYRRMI